MTPPVPQSSARVVPARTTAVARRLLSGAGAATLVAYRRDPDRAVPLLAHGLTSEGELVVVHRRDDVPQGDADEAEVRIDICREALEPNVRILAATMHLLGRIEWLSPSAQGALVTGGRLSEIVRGAAAAPDSMLGIANQLREIAVAILDPRKVATGGVT